MKDHSRKYEHRPLSAPTEQRFLLLDTDDLASDEVRGKIIHRELSSFNKSDDGYIAASYVWGSPENPRQIFLDDGSFLPIAQNCYMMLRQIRSLANGKPLWVDSLCINQTDNGEKSVVICQMASVYSLAARVIVYLGEADEHEAKALRWISRADNELTQVALTPKSQHPDTPDGRVARAAHELLERAWFSRSWVIQEVIKGGDRTQVVCGGSQIRWIELWSTVFFHWPRRAHPPCIPMAMNARSDNCLEGEDGTMLRLLPRMRYCEATDPRDKVFSLVGIALDAESLPKLDYHMSKEQVYTRVARWWVEFYGSLDVLGHADNFEAGISTEAHTMASWVPDWSRRPPRETFGVFEKTCFRAGGPKAVTTFPSPLTPSSSPILKARGILLGNVDMIIGHCEQYADLIDTFRKHGGYGSAKANEQALSHTLSRGYSREHPPSTKDKQRVFETYRLWKTTHSNQSWEPREENRHGKKILDEEYIPCYSNVAKRTSDAQYEASFKARRIGRVLAITENGFFCLAPDTLRQHDAIYIFYGCSTPIALRKVCDHQVVLGQCYVAGVMYSEVLPEEHLGGRQRGVRDDLEGEEPFPFHCGLPRFDDEEKEIEIW